MTPTFTIEGRGHHVLRRLSKSPAGLSALRSAVGQGRTSSWVRKLDHVIGALCREGFVSFDGMVYAITDDGRDKLADMDDGIECSPNVRIFVRAGASA